MINKSTIAIIFFLCLLNTGIFCKSKFDRITDKAFEIVRMSDMVISVNDTNKIDIGVGVMINNARIPICFNFNQLINYFKLQKHKNLIVIVFAKNNWSKKLINSLEEKINEYFFQLDYKRVVIQQGYGCGRGIISDKKKSEYKFNE